MDTLLWFTALLGTTATAGCSFLAINDYIIGLPADYFTNYEEIIIIPDDPTDRTQNNPTFFLLVAYFISVLVPLSGSLSLIGISVFSDNLSIFTNYGGRGISLILFIAPIGFGVTGSFGFYSGALSGISGILNLLAACCQEEDKRIDPYNDTFRTPEEVYKSRHPANPQFTYGAHRATRAFGGNINDFGSRMTSRFRR